MASQIWNTTTLLFLAPVGLMVFVLVRYNRLRHIPGPLVPSLTDFWLQSKIWRGGNFADVVPELHKKYGPVVRWGPNRVSFASAAAIPAIYSTKNVFPKVSCHIILDLENRSSLKGWNQLGIVLQSHAGALPGQRDSYAHHHTG